MVIIPTVTNLWVPSFFYNLWWFIYFWFSSCVVVLLLQGQSVLCARVYVCVLHKTHRPSHLLYTTNNTVSKSCWMIVEKPGMSRPLFVSSRFPPSCYSPPLDGVHDWRPLGKCRVFDDSSFSVLVLFSSISHLAMAAWRSSATVLGKVPSIVLFLAKTDLVRTAICACWRIFPLF